MRLAAILICVLCVLTSCDVTKNVPVTERFSCSVECEYDGRWYKGILDRTELQMTTLTFTSPSSVAGLTMIKTADQVTVRFNNCDYKAESGTYPDGLLINVLCEALTLAGNAASRDPFEGTCGAGEFCLTFDEQNGFPLLLKMSDLPLSVRFLKPKQVA